VTEHLFDVVPEANRGVARAAVSAAFGASGVTGLQAVAGGASGALTYRVEAAGRPYFVRIETRRGAMRNPHQYACMQIAAAAGVAPPLLYVDSDAGVAIMDFLPSRPLDEYPGGALAIARDLGRLAGRLQTTDVFPQFVDYPAALERMLAYVRGSGLFTPGLLDAHCEGFTRIRDAYPWNAEPPVSSHNDPNPRNVIFDGQRLWLVDWETAYRNDLFVDIAILVDNLAPGPEQRETLLEEWLGRKPDTRARARLTLMSLTTRLFYAALGFSFKASVRGGAEADRDLSAPTPDEFRAAVTSGRLAPTGPETLYVLGKMCLASFKAGLDTPGFEEALIVLARG
jgi:Phosphotransferase enzyme family